MPKPKYKIICPYCLEELTPKDIVFESELGTKKKGDKERMELLHKYGKTTITEMSPEVLMNDIIRPGKIKAGEYPTETFENSTSHTNRVCAKCHFPIPTDAGKCKMVMIGLVGDTKVGKTVYMLSLAKELVNYFVDESAGGLYRADNVSILYQGEDTVHTKAGENRKSSIDAMYDGYSREEIAKRFGQRTADNIKHERIYLLPEQTPETEYQFPIIFKLPLTKKEEGCLLVIYDISGEALKKATTLVQVGAFMRHADGLVFMFNTKEYKVNKELIFSMIYGGGNRLRPCYIALTATKADDVYRDAVMKNDHELMRKLDFSVFGGGTVLLKGGFNWQLAYQISAIIRDLYGLEIKDVESRIEKSAKELSTKKPEYRKIVRKNLKMRGKKLDEEHFCRYFALSSLGLSVPPEEQRVDWFKELREYKTKHPSYRSADAIEYQTDQPMELDKKLVAASEQEHAIDETEFEASARLDTQTHTERLAEAANEEETGNVYYYTKSMPHGQRIESPIAWILYMLGLIDPAQYDD